MGPSRPRKPPPPGGEPAPLLLPGLLLLLSLASGVCSLEIQADSNVQALVGEPVTLRCWFQSSSPVTEKLTIDWTYRPLTGGKLEPIFHYQSEAYPAQSGTFRDRISWAGDVNKQDASIRISNPTMDDNGTFTCTVRNPPDVQHNIPQTVLMVTQRGASFQLTSAGLLSILVFLPSAIVIALLLVRMGKKLGLLKSRKKFSYKKSSIEVSDEPEQAGCGQRLADWCLQCLDTDEEDPY
uniref:Myelin protein zero-like protein 3 n=1 Tax=Pogona vitticeps TaxID=103695 RepID=A0A6J0TUN6_9SAUR